MYILGFKEMYLLSSIVGIKVKYFTERGFEAWLDVGK